MPTWTPRTSVTTVSEVLYEQSGVNYESAWYTYSGLENSPTEWTPRIIPT